MSDGVHLNEYGLIDTEGEPAGLAHERNLLGEWALQKKLARLSVEHEQILREARDE